MSPDLSSSSRPEPSTFRPAATQQNEANQAPSASSPAVSSSDAATSSQNVWLNYTGLAMMVLSALATVLAIIHGVTRWAHLGKGGLFLAAPETWLNHQNSPALKLMLAVEQYAAVLAVWAAVAAIIGAYLAWGLPRLGFSGAQPRFSVLLESLATILFALVILFLGGYACFASGGQPLMIVGIPLAIQFIPILILGITLLVLGVRSLVLLLKALSDDSVSSPAPRPVMSTRPSQPTRTTVKPKPATKTAAKSAAKTAAKTAGASRGTQPAPQRLKVTSVKPGTTGKPAIVPKGKTPRKGGAK